MLNNIKIWVQKVCFLAYFFVFMKKCIYFAPDFVKKLG